MAKHIQIGKNKPRPLTEDDVDTFLRDASQRPKVKTIESLRANLVARHPYRWRRMMKDMEYFKRQLEKQGANPEDLPWLM